jgi:alpha-D-xyloside xylohydrolase
MQALRLRYQLMPYIYKTMKQSSESGLPVMRAMPLAFPNERLAHSFELQFMFGDSLLVAPCTNAEGRVEVYLPQGNWLRFPNKQKYTGLQLLTLTLALDEMAVFMPEHHSIPIGANVENVEMLESDFTQTENLPHWPNHQIE